MMNDYVHGYSDDEARRLRRQASFLAPLLHDDSRFPAGSTVLEVGCGIGAQTKIIAAANPRARFTCIDRNGQSLLHAAQEIERVQLPNVCFQRADIYDLPFADNRFDHVLCCFVLEHLPDPCMALGQMKRTLKKGGRLTIIEGDHGSFLSFPESQESRRVVQCLIELQARAGGNALIGRELSALLRLTGFGKIRVAPRQVYADASSPEAVEGFSKKTFIAMVEGVKDQAISAGLVSRDLWEKGLADLYAGTGLQGSFCYTFFKATAENC